MFSNKPAPTSANCAYVVQCTRSLLRMSKNSYVGGFSRRLPLRLVKSVMPYSVSLALRALLAQSRRGCRSACTAGGYDIRASIGQLGAGRCGGLGGGSQCMRRGH
jgi:hypothetical protein